MTAGATGRESTLMGINKREEGKKVNSNINVTPMVDVMLVLLIIFMVITPMLNNKVNVDLPVANAAILMDNANKEDAITVAVTRDGRAYLGGDPVNLDELAAKIAAKLENKTDKEVYLRADIRANYGKVMDAVDQIRAAGVSKLGLLTEKREVDESTPLRSKQQRRPPARGDRDRRVTRRFAMGMGGGGGTGKAMSDINVTPLIDVLLVLLIIFMVIVPVTPKGLDTLIPQPPKNKTAAAAGADHRGSGAGQRQGRALLQDQRGRLRQVGAGAQAGGNLRRPQGKGDVRQRRFDP